MSDEAFGPLLAFSDIEAAVLGHYKHWMHTWLSARERKLGLAPLSISRPRSWVNKQTLAALPGEERTPIVIAVSDGFQSAPDRHGSGTYDAYFRFGIAAVCLAIDNNKVRELTGHYQAALLGIALKHRSINSGQIQMNELRDLKTDDLDEEATGRSMAAVRIELTYVVRGFVEDGNPPDYVEPPPDEILPPQPGDPSVQTVFVDVDKVGVN